MSASAQAVFLSYASQDAEAAKKICDALRAAGLEVWFDQNELRGGDAWDQKIRRQIKECALFVPVISPNTNARPEGYFRLEWKLAVDRSHLLADDHPFLFPIALEGVTDANARVPEKFKEVQWTRLRLDETPAELGVRVARLLHGTAVAPGNAQATTPRPTISRASRWQWWMVFPIVGTLMGLLFAAGPFLRSIRGAPTKAAAATPRPPDLATPARSTLSEARQLADRAFAFSVEKYDSSLDDFKLADSLMNKALALDPDDGEILARAAQLQLMFRNRGFDYGQERVARGREQAERAVRLAPDSAEAVYALSLAQRYTGNPAAAIESLERTIVLDPNHARALLSLGSNRISRGQTAEGLAFYARARQHAQWAPLADYYEFLRQFAHRDFVEADRLIRNAYRHGPSANTAAGIALVHLTWDGDLDTAAQELAAVPTHLLNAPRVVYLTALVQLARRRPDDALKALERLPDDFVQDAWITGPRTALIGRAHALAGRDAAARLAWTEALRIVDERLKAAAGDAALHHNRGMLLAWLGREDEALAEARIVQELARSNTGNWNLCEVTIYAALGRADLALPLAEKMINDRTDRWNWPLTPRLLSIEPLWDKLRSAPQFRQLAEIPPAASK